MQQFFSDYGPYVLVALLAATCALLVWVVRLQAQVRRMILHYRRLAQGVRGNLDEVLEVQLQKIDKTSQRLDEVSRSLREVEGRSLRAVQHVGVQRYNPFEDTGGDQSFSVALMDDGDNGVVLTSIFSRAQCRVYAKPLDKGASSYPLSAEEEEAVKLARGGRLRSAGKQGREA